MLLVWMIALGKTFLKSLRKSQTIQEVDEDQAKEQYFHEEPKGEAVMFSRDSLEPEGWFPLWIIVTFDALDCLLIFALTRPFFFFL